MIFFETSYGPNIRPVQNTMPELVELCIQLCSEASKICFSSRVQNIFLTMALRRSCSVET